MPTLSDLDLHSAVRVTDYRYIRHGEPTPEGYEDAGDLPGHHARWSRLVSRSHCPSREIVERIDATAAAARYGPVCRNPRNPSAKTTRQEFIVPRAVTEHRSPFRPMRFHR